VEEVMNIHFATCNRSIAREYIKKVIPNLKDDNENLIGILDLVEKGIVRVQDPMMYGKRIGILPTKNWDEKYRENVMKYGIALQDLLT